MVGLARRLQDLGHEVRVATAAGFVPSVEAAGLQGVVAGRDWLESEAATTLPGFLEGGMRGQFKAFAQLGAGFLDDLLADPWRPDLVVRESVEFAGAVYAERLGVPCVTHGITLRAPLALLEHWGSEALRALTEREGARCGTEVFERGTILNHFPRSWMPAEVAPLANEQFFAPAEGPGSGTRPSWLRTRSADRPLVYATLGTVFNAAHVIFERLIEAADGAGYDLLITVGGNGDPDSFSHPENVNVERYVDQDDILGYATAVVCHGGMGTVMGTLRHGLPICCIPLSADQPINAMRCEALRCGRNYTTCIPADGPPVPHARPDDVQAGPLREHIDALLEDTSYRDAARAIADEIRALPGVIEEAELLIELAAQPAPT